MTQQKFLILNIIKYSGFLWLGEFYIWVSICRKGLS